MKHIIIAALVGLIGACALAAPAQARDHVFVGVGLGGYGCCGYYPYYPAYAYGYPAYYAPTYYAPPPTVVYTQPAQVTYASPSPPAQATQTSNTYVDDKGRTCRMFQSTLEGAPVNGTACLQADGSWHTVN